MQRIGQYEVVRELGRGGMGVVYAVHDPASGRELALKLILPGLADAEALARFGREAELLARVRHPGVLAIHRLGRAPEGPFLVTELLEGETLKAALTRGPFPPQRAAEVVAALADAVAAVHAVGVLHRDLKPENVILTAEGRPVLLDFGLAREDGPERLTRTGALLGTPGYMSPEQADGRSDLGPAVDVYGLGATLYALLTGHAPFEGAVPAVLRAVLLEEPRWPAQERAEVPAALDAICRRSMAKDPAARHPDAAALRADLERFLRGEAPAAAPRGRARGVAAATLALLALGGLVLARGGRVAPEPAPPDPTSAKQDEQGGPAAGARPASDAVLLLTALARAPRAEQVERALSFLREYPDHERADEARARGLRAALESSEAVRLGGAGPRLRWRLQPAERGGSSELVVTSEDPRLASNPTRVVRCDLSGAVITTTALRALQIDVIGPLRPGDEGALYGGEMPAPASDGQRQGLGRLTCAGSAETGAASARCRSAGSRRARAGAASARWAARPTGGWG